MEAVTTPGGESRWTYSAGGRPERIDYANETRAEFGYTAGARRLASVVHREGVAPGADVMAAAQYTYDVNGNRLSQVLTIAGVTETTTYTYDALDQLRSFSVLPGAGAPPGAEPRHTWYGHERYRRVFEGRCRGGASLVEDDTVPTGLRCADGGLQTVASALTYEGPHGQISRIENPLAVHSAGEGVAVVEYEHDFAGNLVARRTQVGTDASGDPIEEVDLFRYDALNRLVETARGPPGAAELLGRYGYNADGLRTRVRESDRNADAWYDGLSLLMERVEEDGGGENDPWMNTVRYHHDPGGLHAITAAHDGAGYARTTHFANRDGIGSTLAVSRPVPGTGGAGLVAASWRTDPWGLVTAETGVDHVNASIFTGHQHDFDTGLIYMRARFYDPALGRFLSADTWLGEAQNPRSLQRFLYAYGNPGVWWDPDGRRPWMAGMDSEALHLSRCEGLPHHSMREECMWRLHRGEPIDGAALMAGYVNSFEAMAWSSMQFAEGAAFVGTPFGMTYWVATGEVPAVQHDWLRRTATGSVDGTVTRNVSERLGIDTTLDEWLGGNIFGMATQIALPPIALRAMMRFASRAGKAGVEATRVQLPMDAPRLGSGRAWDLPPSMSGAHHGGAGVNPQPSPAQSSAAQRHPPARVASNLAANRAATQGSGFAAASQRWTLRAQVSSNLAASQTARASSGFRDASQRWDAAAAGGGRGGQGRVGSPSATGARVADGSVRFGRWRLGDAIDKPMRDGSAAAWRTVQSRYWKNRFQASSGSGEFSLENLRRMRRGLAPQVFNPRTGRFESMELHHVIPRRHGGSNSPLNLRELTPDQHGAVDPFRFTVPTSRGVR